MSDDELIEELQRYPQVGEHRAQEIVELVREHGPDADVETAREELEEAAHQLDRDRGNSPAFAEAAVHRAIEALGESDSG